VLNRLCDRSWQKLHEATGATGRGSNQRFERLYRDICILIQPAVFIEIGAFDASFARQLCTLLPETKFFAYEANPYVFRRFETTMPGSVSYANMAIGANEGTASVFIPRLIPGRDGPMTFGGINPLSSLRTRTIGGVEYETVAVSSTTLDLIIERSGDPLQVAVWIDAEGAIGDVLGGARACLNRNLSAIFVEMENYEEWTGQWQAQQVVEHLAGCEFVPLARDCETIWQYNTIFIKEHLVEEPVLGLVDGYIEDLVKANGVVLAESP
jgi:FkbM family methyltransferase